MPKKAAVILVNYKDYADRYLLECIESIRKQDFSGEIKIYITDNESTEGSLAVLKRMAPEAELIINKNNDGFAKGNNDAIKLALKQGSDFIILFNMDTVVAENCVSKMVEAAENPPDPLYQGGTKEIGAVQARLMLYNEKNKINSIGNVTHFLGFGYSAGYNEEYKSSPPASAVGADICYPSGAAVLFKAEALKRTGLFDEEFWMYNEDQDLGWRTWLAGYRCVLAPEAAVYHKYEFSRSIKKYYWMDRNRIIAMLKNYRLATLILILPAFIVMELGLLFFSATNGWFKEKIKVYEYFLNSKNWQRLLIARWQAQNLRQAKDKEIVKLFSGKIWYQEIGDGRLRVANVVFNAYWKLVRVLIRW